MYVQAEVCRFGVVGLLVGRATVDSASRQADRQQQVANIRLLPLAYVHSKQLLTSTVWSNARAFLCRGVVMVLLIFPCYVGFIVGCVAAAALCSLHLTIQTWDAAKGQTHLLQTLRSLAIFVAFVLLLFCLHNLSTINFHPDTFIWIFWPALTSVANDNIFEQIRVGHVCS